MQKEGSTHILCFVDFASPAHAAVALDALQGKFLLCELHLIIIFSLLTEKLILHFLRLHFIFCRIAFCWYFMLC